MTLLDDLRALADIEAITNARASISGSVSADGVSIVVEGGAATSALGDVGATIARLTEALEDPASLLEPLASALLAVAGDLAERVAPDSLPLDDYLQAVTAAVSIVTSLIDRLGDDPLALLTVAGRALPDALRELPERVAGSVGGAAEEVGKAAALLAAADRGLPTDVDGLLDVAFEVLSPFPRAALDGLRARVDALLAATASLSLPATRTEGLVLRLDAVTAAAVSGDAAAVTRALAELDRVRLQTLDVIRADLAVVVAAVDGLPVTAFAEAVQGGHEAIVRAETGLLDVLESCRRTVVTLRESVADLDLSELLPLLRLFLDRAEVALREHVVAPIEAQVDRAVEWLRATLAEVPVRPLRTEITVAVQAAAQAVRDADLDEPATRLRETVAGLADAVADVDVLGTEVRAAVEQAREALSGVVTTVTDALAQVEAAIRGVMDEAGSVLTTASEAVAAFEATVLEASVTIQALDLHTPAQQIVDAVVEIRVVVEEVLSEVPLPEPMRPLVDQLVGQLEALNIEAEDLASIPVLAPILDVADQFGDALSEGVRGGLAALSDAVAGIVPTELIASIEAEVGAALDVVAGFEPTSLLEGVTGAITAAADAVEGLDLDALVEPVRAPYVAILDLWDRVRPSVLLEPAGRAFAEAIEAVSLPDPEALVLGVAGVVETTGNEIGAAATAPLTRLGPEGTTAPATPPDRSGGGQGGSAPPPAPQPAPGTATGASSVRVGDVVRVFGYLPAKIREALLALDAGAMGAVLAGIDRATAGLAADLRLAADAVALAEASLDVSLDALCAPVGAAQARAQLAVAASFGAGGASVTLDVDATFDLLAVCGPGSLRADVAAADGAARGRVRGAVARQASVASELHGIADALDGSSLTRLVRDADAFLAALDPEPLALEVDALAAEVVLQAPALVADLGEGIEEVLLRFRALLGELTPGAQLVKFGAVLDVLREQLDLLDPRLLAAELDEIHAAVRASLAAYDPAVLAADLEGVLATVATRLRALDPAALLGELDPLSDLVAAAAGANPATALASLAADMTAVAESFAAIDLDAVIEAATGLPDMVVAAFAEVLQGIRQEIAALLDSLRYVSGGVSASVEVSV